MYVQHHFHDIRIYKLITKQQILYDAVTLIFCPLAIKLGDLWLELVFLLVQKYCFSTVLVLVEIALVT